MKIKHTLSLFLLAMLMSASASAQGKWMYDFIVPDNGTFRQAIHAANTRKDKAIRYRIFVKSGHYRMHTNPDDIISTVIDGKKVEAPPKEMELLFYLASSPNRVYTRNQLLDEVWGCDYFGDSRTVDVHVKRLREKLEGVSEKWCLRTVWGVGYKFEVL